MDIQIKYREGDKKAKIAELIGEAVREGMRHNGKFRDKLVNQIMSVMNEESVYNQTKEKEIESVEISKYSSVVKMILKSCGNLLGINIQVSDKIHAVSFEKYEVKEIIEILQQIHDQMD